MEQASKHASLLEEDKDLFKIDLHLTVALSHSKNIVSCMSELLRC
jgi:hypothetical protein